MNQFQFTRFDRMPPVIKNLLIINGIVFFAQLMLPQVDNNVGLYLFNSEHFKPYQIATHLFAHGNFMHIFLNMFALYLFGVVLENVWGSKRFLLFYFICGIGAAALHSLVGYYEYHQAALHLSAENIQMIKTQGKEVLDSMKNYSDPYMAKANIAQNVPAVGASGAVFGVLTAFGVLFPNTVLYIYGILPMKAKYLVIIYIAIELYSGFLSTPGDNVAHFAHIGGALFGFIMVKIWSGNKNHFY